MADDLSPVWDPLQFSPYYYPNNLPEINGTALSFEQKEQLNAKILRLRKEQFQHLCSHLEIRGIIREFMFQLIDKKPRSEFIPKFCKEFFAQPKGELQTKVNKHVRDLLDDSKKPSQQTQKELNSLDTHDCYWYWSDSSELSD